MSDSVLAVDVGGTNIKFGVVKDGTLKEVVTIPTEAELGKDIVIKKIIDIIRAQPSEIKSVGIAIAGLVEHSKGVVFSPPNLPGWTNVKLKEIIVQETRVNAYVLNDANAYALGEWKYGAGHNKENVIAITLGTGVGGGIIANGRLLIGSTHFAGEIGHMVIDPLGPPCNCGQRGCWEAYLGSDYFVKRVKSYYNHDNLSLEEYTTKFLYKLAKEGDYKAISLWQEYGEFLGLGLVNLIHIFDPDIIVIGGGIANAFELFIESCLDVLSERVMEFQKRKVQIVKAKLNDAAALLGAYYYALMEGDV
ncbi:MAG: ROK family protein [candidate division WOR-3 bacterium]